MKGRGKMEVCGRIKKKKSHAKEKPTTPVVPRRSPI